MCKSILVVDDDWTLRSTLRALLESEGYAVETASDGQNALEKLSQQAQTYYEAVLLDVGMPRMDGLQLIRVLQQQEAAWAYPLIVMSGCRESLQQAVGMGVSHVLEKPFDLEAVLALVTTCLAGHQGRGSLERKGTARLPTQRGVSTGTPTIGQKIGPPSGVPAAHRWPD